MPEQALSTLAIVVNLLVQVISVLIAEFLLERLKKNPLQP